MPGRNIATMLEIENVCEVIAERRFVLSGAKDGRRDVVLRIGMPQEVPDGSGHYYAPFQIVGLGSATVHRSVGVDAIQALQGALKMAGVELHHYRRGYGNRLYFLEEGDDLGFGDEAWAEGLAHQIVLAFGPVYGLKLAISGNAGSMKVFHFGEIKPHPDGKGTIGQFALHIQCPWRIVTSNQILTGSADWWEPSAHDAAGDLETWTRERPTPSSQETVLARLFGHYDAETKSYINDADQLVVQQVEADDFGGFKIHLSGGYRLEVFPDGIHGESWRLFEPGNDATHFIIEGGRFGHREERLRLLQRKTFISTRFEYAVPPDDVYCHGCWAKLSPTGPGLHEGYVTAVEMDKAEREEILRQERWQRIGIHPALERGIDLYWICPSCFDEFKENLGFTAVAADSPAKLWQEK